MSRIRISLVAAMLCAGFAVAADDPAEAAARARAEGRIDEAIAAYGRAVQQRPAWAEGWFYLGTLLYEKDRFAEAVPALQRLVTLQPQGAAGWAFLGLSEFETKQYARAAEHLTRAEALGLPGGGDPLTDQVRYQKAVMLTRAGKFEPALKYLHLFSRRPKIEPRVIELTGLAALERPKSPDAIVEEERELVVRTGRAILTAGESLDRAIELLGQIADDFPKAATVRYRQGLFLLNSNADRALELFVQELAINPGHVPSMVTAALEYLKRNDPVKAEPLAKQAAKKSPLDFPSRLAYGRALLALDRAALALPELQMALKLAPDSPPVRFALAAAYQKLGRTADAARERAEFTRLEQLRSRP